MSKCDRLSGHSRVAVEKNDGTWPDREMVFAMGLKKIPTEGGSGGKRGHSNMEHWFYTDEIKDAARVQRRLADKREVSIPREERHESVKQGRGFKRPSKQIAVEEKKERDG